MNAVIIIIIGVVVVSNIITSTICTAATANT